MKKLLVTCGLPYSNGDLHVGHLAGCYLPADIYVRYQRLVGREVAFVCGSDDHGVPIKLTADREGKTPAAVASHFNKRHQSDFKSVGVEFDIYSSTSGNPYHQDKSQEIFNDLYKKDYFTKKTSEQFYDETNDMFLPDRYVKGTCGYCQAKDQNSDQCEECGKVLDVEHLSDPYSVLSNAPATIKETAHWYLDLTRFKNTVSNWLEAADVREQSKQFVRGLINNGLVERSMTRDLSWGVPVPLEDPDAAGKVLYVWFDAPIGYISNSMELAEKLYGDKEEYSRWWKSEDSEIVHFIGEDNTIFHCIIWIAMLEAAGEYNLPTGVVVNKFLNFKTAEAETAEKISKSKRIGVWINEFIQDGGNPDTLRFYLTSIAPEKARTVYSPEDLIQKHNAELANTLGNFANRVLSFYNKHFGDKILNSAAEQVEDDLDFIEKRKNLSKEVGECLNNYQFKQAQETLFNFVRHCNSYIDNRAPWQLRKTDEASCGMVLVNCIQAIASIAICLQPFLPDTASKLAEMLQLTELNWEDAAGDLPEGHVLGETKILFAKIEVE